MLGSELLRNEFDFSDEQSRIESRSRDAEFSMENSGKTTSDQTLVGKNHGRVSFWSTSTIILFCFESADKLTKESLSNMAVREQKVFQDY